MAKLDGHLEVITYDTKLRPGDVVRMVGIDCDETVSGPFSDCIVTKVDGGQYSLARPHARVDLTVPASPVVYQAFEEFTVGLESLLVYYRLVTSARGRSMNVGGGS